MNPTDVTIVTPKIDGVMHQSSNLAIRCRGFVITDTESHGECLMLLQDMKAWMTGVRDLLKEPIELAHRTHKSLTTMRGTIIDPVNKMYNSLMDQALAWEKSETIRAEAEARKQESAQREADEQAALEEAGSAQDMGQHEQAEEILAAQAEAPDPVVKPTPRVSQVKGTHNVTNWRAELVNPLAAIKYIVENPQWVGVVQFDKKKMNALAKAQHEGFRFGGFRAVKTVTKSVAG